MEGDGRRTCREREGERRRRTTSGGRRGSREGEGAEGRARALVGRAAWSREAASGGLKFHLRERSREAEAERRRTCGRR